MVTLVDDVPDDDTPPDPDKIVYDYSTTISEQQNELLEIKENSEFKEANKMLERERKKSVSNVGKTKPQEVERGKFAKSAIGIVDMLFGVIGLGSEAPEPTPTPSVKNKSGLKKSNKELTSDN